MSLFGVEHATVLVVKFDGVCVRCAATVPRGTKARYLPRSRRVMHEACWEKAEAEAARIRESRFESKERG